MNDLPVGPVDIVVRRLSTQGGTERYGLGFVRWLVKRGVRVRVWCHDAAVSIPGAEVHRVLARGRGRAGRLLATAWSARQIPRDGVTLGLCRVPNMDVFRAGGGAHASAMRRLGTWSAADFLEAHVDRMALRSAAWVVANSELARQDIVSVSGRSDSQVCIVRNGVDLSQFTPSTISVPADAPLLFVGHGFARKGLSTALMAMVSMPEHRLDVVGMERRMGTYQAMAESLGVSSRVTFLGPVEDLASTLRNHRALLLPTRYDPSANVVLEAMACGVPPVTTAADGASEVLPVSWLKVERPDDVGAFVAAVRRAVSEPDLPLRCRAAAEQWSSDRSYAALAVVLGRAESLRRRVIE